jgi:hypothetical protein
MDEQPYLRDLVDDAVVAGRETLRVAPAKPQSTGGTFFISFMLNFDEPTCNRLNAASKQSGRSVTKMLERYLKAGFLQYFSVNDEAEEVEQKVAA